MDRSTAKLLGCEMPERVDSETMVVLTEMIKGGLNARQCVEKVK